MLLGYPPQPWSMQGAFGPAHWHYRNDVMEWLWLSQSAEDARCPGAGTTPPRIYQPAVPFLDARSPPDCTEPAYVSLSPSVLASDTARSKLPEGLSCSASLGTPSTSPKCPPPSTPAPLLSSPLEDSAAPTWDGSSGTPSKTARPGVLPLPPGLGPPPGLKQWAMVDHPACLKQPPGLNVSEGDNEAEVILPQVRGPTAPLHVEVEGLSLTSPAASVLNKSVDGICIGHSTVNGNACVRVEWKLGNFKRKIEKWLDHPVVSPDISMPDLPPGLKLMVTMARNSEMEAVRQKEKVAKLKKLMTEGKLQFFVTVKMPSELACPIRFFLTVGDANRCGPFSSDFKDSPTYVCNDLDKNLLSMEDAAGGLSIILEVMTS